MEKTAKENCEVRLGKTEPLVLGKKVYISSNDRNLTEKEMEKARIELGETEEKKQKYIQELKNKLSKQGKYRIDDDFLLRFLRVRKFDIKRAYENIKNYYEIRSKYLDLFGSPAKIKACKNLKIVTVLPYVDEQGRPINWFDIEHFDPQVMPLEDYAQSVFAMWDVLNTNPRFQVNGYVEVWDMRTFRFMHVTEFLKKNRLYKLISVLNNSYPWRMKKIVVLGSNRFTRYVYSICRPLLKKKLTDRVILLGSDPSEIYEHFDPAILPKKLGGMLEDDFCQRPEIIFDNIPYLEYDRSFTGRK